MSLMAPRSEKDKSGKDCYACDVAVNSVWYDQTMVDSLTFTTFLVTVAMEGLCNKYGDTCNLDRQNWSILRNKRYMGKDILDPVMFVYHLFSFISIIRDADHMSLLIEVKKYCIKFIYKEFCNRGRGLSAAI